MARFPLSIFAALLAVTTPAVAQDANPCSRPDNRTYVQGDGECLHIRTFTREVKDPNPVLMVFLHGDKSSGGPVSWELNYGQRFMSESLGAVTVVRPGYPAEGGGKSSGPAGREDHYTDRNITAVAGALKRLKEFHKARKLVLVGYSGGAATTGVILGKFPGLADAAVLIACPCNIQEWRSFGGRGSWPRSLSPSDFAAKVPEGTRVLALTGNRDTNTIEKLGRDYAAKLKSRGIDAEYRTVPEVNHDTIASNSVTVEAITAFLKQVAAQKTAQQ